MIRSRCMIPPVCRRLTGAVIRSYYVLGLSCFWLRTVQSAHTDVSYRNLHALGKHCGNGKVMACCGMRVQEPRRSTTCVSGVASHRGCVLSMWWHAAFQAARCA